MNIERVLKVGVNVLSLEDVNSYMKRRGLNTIDKSDLDYFLKYIKSQNCGEVRKLGDNKFSLNIQFNNSDKDFITALKMSKYYLSL